ncbi:tyrosine-protein phosphatase [Myroides sp. M-43]|uniref:tyrosine-protein phosphatase n=1 Tax=Myroides oncorhynchi TaxID=2893756 RepID=UPI001E61E87D|nr:tyrosine-protein phosphatase [Myroides oncorhynchi]MCC9042166.1 tyrosine-protein phosphatase [Myroides oncorhynchi]
MRNLKKDNNSIQRTDVISTKNIETFELCVLETDTEITVSGLRQLPLEGQSNFRDLGGYKTKDNRIVKWGQLFRSGQLSNLTTRDLNYLSSIPLTTIIDFRSEEESIEQKTLLPSTVSNEILLPIRPGNLSKNNVMKIVMDANDELANKLLVDINEQLVLHNQNEYKAFFKEVQGANAPLMFNCTAGKDRTGLAAALLLTALGVDINTVREDYLLTNQCVNLDTLNMQEKFLLNDDQTNVLLTLFTVKEQYLNKALTTIEQHYSTVESFLIDALDVDIPLLKSKYLY